MTETARHIALLAPVPRRHLVDGVGVAATEGRVAFGSRAWDVFRELDVARRALPVDVYFYASHAQGRPKLEISWHGRYIGHVESVGGAHPDGMRYRPPSTAKYPSDNHGHWAIFWEVESLRELEPSQCLRLATFTGYGKRRQYGKAFVPEGPLLVEHP